MSTQLPQSLAARPNGRSRLSFSKLAAIAGIVFSSLTYGNLPAAAQGEVRSTHGDWQMRCDTPPGSTGDQCALIQNVTAATGKTSDCP